MHLYPTLIDSIKKRILLNNTFITLIHDIQKQGHCHFMYNIEASWWSSMACHQAS